jgi:hypothetical protein
LGKPKDVVRAGENIAEGAKARGFELFDSGNSSTVVVSVRLRSPRSYRKVKRRSDGDQMRHS